MRLVVDLQVLQTSDADRGMGLYTKSVLSALGGLWNDGSHEVVGVLNKNLAGATEVEAWFKGALKNSETTQVDLAINDKSTSTFGHRYNTNKRNLDNAISELWGTGSAYTYFIPAQFSSEVFPVYPDYGSVVKTQLFHDLIPYLFSDHYFQSYESTACVDYCERFRSVYESDLIVTNSQTTADDLCIHLGFDQSRLRAIFGSGADRSAVVPKKPRHFDVPKKYILMPSGDDFRKNNSRGVLAFEQARGELGDIHLLVTSSFSQGSQNALRRISDRIIFTGNVPPEEYEWLIKNSSCVFFPTEYEGLGMPVIEAVSSGVPVVCSDIPVFREIHRSALNFSDPHSVQSMSGALTEVVKGNGREVTKTARGEILDRFNWDNTAKLFSEALHETCKPNKSKSRQKIAIFAPAVDSYSAIGKYVLESHAELVRCFDIDYYFEQGRTKFKPTRLNILKHVAPSKDAACVVSPGGYDKTLYHIGNSEFHINTILNALANPGTSILHDCKLNGIFEYMTRNGLISRERFEAERLLSEAYSSNQASDIVSIVNHSNRVVCHSDYVSRAVKKTQINGTSDVMISNLAVGTPQIQSGNNHGGEITVTFAGIIAPEKGLGLIEEVASIPGVHVKIFGYSVLGHDRQINRDVEVLRDLSDLEFQSNMRDSDILIGYREKYNGETSKTVIEALRYGINVIVKDIGWFSELPDRCVHKVDSSREIITTIERIMRDEKLRHSVSESAREYADSKLNFGQYAKRIQEVL